MKRLGCDHSSNAEAGRRMVGVSYLVLAFSHVDKTLKADLVFIKLKFFITRSLEAERRVSRKKDGLRTIKGN